MKTQNGSHETAISKLNDDQPEIAIAQAKEASKNILALKNAGFLRKIFPDKQYREYINSQLAVIKTELEARRIILKNMRDAQIEVMRKAYEAWASEQCVHIDKEKERAIYLLIEERTVEIDKVADKVIQCYYAKIDKVEGLREGRAKDLERNRIEKELDDFYDRIEHFTEEFMKSVVFHLKRSEIKTH